jgi:AcrR family transcriptional regulator
MDDGGYRLLWDERARPARGRPAGLNRERIVAAAIALADDEGLPKVSMKRVAEALGSGVMSLYRHVPGKDELVLLMYDGLMAGPLSLPEDATRRDLLLEWGRTIRDLFVAHPWALAVATDDRVMGPHEAAWVDAVMGRLVAVGLPPQLGLVAVLTVYCFVLGGGQPRPVPEPRGPGS